MPSSHAQFLWAGKMPCAKCSHSWRIITGECALSIELSEFVSVRVPSAEGHSFLGPYKSGRRLPHSKSWRIFGLVFQLAKRLGVRQPSGALEQTGDGLQAAPRLKLHDEHSRHWRGHGRGRAHSALARSVRRTFHETGFYRW